MKLLFDHHLSPTLVDRLSDLFPDSNHVWNLKLHDASDAEIWMYAREHGYTVVSKDADFSDLSMQLGYPPKLLWLRITNWSTHEIEELIRSRYPLIAELPDATERGIRLVQEANGLSPLRSPWLPAGSFSPSTGV